QPPNERDAAGRHSPLASRRPPSTAGSDRRRTIRQKALLDRGARTNRRSVLPLVGTRSPRIARLPGLRIRLARLDNLSWRSGVPDTCWSAGRWWRVGLYAGFCTAVSRNRRGGPPPPAGGSPPAPAA